MILFSRVCNLLEDKSVFMRKQKGKKISREFIFKVASRHFVSLTCDSEVIVTCKKRRKFNLFLDLR